MEDLVRALTDQELLVLDFFIVEEVLRVQAVNRVATSSATPRTTWMKKNVPRGREGEEGSGVEGGIVSKLLDALVI